MSIPTQYGISHSADFEANTWTFELEPGFATSAGRFAIAGLLLAIVAPLFVVFCPISAWYSYRRKMRRYEEIYAYENREWP